jgi:vanillate/3-O-methylgallate O-demethylase
MTHSSLEQKLQAVESPATMARNSRIAPYSLPKVPAEFSNWRDEQIAWRETAALLDLTHHMTDLTVEGPDTIRLLSSLGVNSFENFQVNKAKQFVCCNSDGYVIGDGILFYLARNKVSLLGLPAAHNWVQFHAQSGRFDVTVHRDEPTAANPNGKRKLYRFQVQGPNALKVLEKATGGPVSEIKFFNMDELQIAGRTVRALRHGMAGAPGLELFGPIDEGDEVRTAILKAGEEFGLRQVGSIAYPTTTLESGWISGPVPAIFTGDELKAYRQWLPATGYEAMSTLGGSFYSEDIADYYVTPYELGYGPLIKFDHDFIGRAALEAMADKPHRRKVTLAWNADDVTAAMHTLFEAGSAAKYISLPWSGYSLWHFDKVLKGGQIVGVSTRCGYSYNERAMLSLAMVEPDVVIGAEVTLVWGEEGGGSKKSMVERHRQFQMRAVVSPCPYSKVVRTSYEPGWRTHAELP